MTPHLTKYRLHLACLALVLTSVQISSAQQTPQALPVHISDSDIAALQAEFAQLNQKSSSSSKRRACKSTVRSGAALIKDAPTAPNRFRVLTIMLQSQKRLLLMDNDERNRKNLFEICDQLAQAPDAYAELRLEADLLLSDRELTLKDADIKERALALAALIKRYRETPGEAKSLMIAALIAPKLDAFDLEKEIIQAMSDRFAGDPVVIGWRRKHLAVSRLDVLFTGTYMRADGVSLSFPLDTMGHTSLMYFWSQETPDFEKHLAAVKAMQLRCPGQVDFYSFNVDQLPDAGEKILRAQGLDWTPMHLPGGRRSSAYRAYATQDPLGVRVNAHGHAYVHPSFIKAFVEEMPMEQDLDDVRYLAQMQSLFIGDFLVAHTDADNKVERSADAVPPETLDAIQACFVAAPMRYRLTSEQALANYTQAETLCRAAIEKHAAASDLWRVRNRRIIALVGMWNLATEPKHLEAAAEEARAVLATELPKGADVAAQFCLVKEAFRLDANDPKSVLSNLIEKTGAAEAPAFAYATAAILAMDANAIEFHAKYRQMVLETHNDNPMLWPVVSFLLDQNHTFRLFKANYYLPPSRARRVVRGALRINARKPVQTPRVLNAEFKTLSGDTLVLPRDAKGKLTFVLFIEPPTDEADATFQDGIVKQATQLADTHVRQGIDVIVAFLSDDANAVNALMKKNAWTCQAVMVPGGLKNPLVPQQGILWADRVPNIALVHPDGTVVWQISGLLHPQLKSEGVGETTHTMVLGMQTHIDLSEMDISLKALQQGKLQDALQLLAGPFPRPARFQPTRWSAPRHHGRALVYIALKNWDAALIEIDAAIETHRRVYTNKNPCTCQRMAGFRLIKANLHDQLGQADQAKDARELAATATKTHLTSPYTVFHDQLNALKIEGSK